MVNLEGDVGGRKQSPNMPEPLDELALNIESMEIILCINGEIQKVSSANSHDSAINRKA